MSTSGQTSYPFGLWTLVALVVGNAIGAGIYTTSGFSLAALGSVEWVLLAWVVAGFIALGGALSYGMLVKGIQESGGEYLFLSRSIHPLAGFIAGWISLLAGFPGAIAFSASAFEAYLKSAGLGASELPTDSIAVTLVVAAACLHLYKTNVGARIHEWIVSAMLVALVLIIAWSIATMLQSPTAQMQDTVPLVPFNLLAFASSLVWISLSYSGFNAASYIAGEVRNAASIVPKGMVIGTLITMFVCVVLNAIILYSIEPASLSGKAEIAAIAAESLAGSSGRHFIELIIALSLLTSVTAMAMAGPRVYAKMAEDGALPKMFRSKNDAPPRNSILLQMGVSLCLILIADLRTLMGYLGMTLSLCLALAVCSLFVRHKRLGERPHSFWYPAAPLTFVFFTVILAVLSGINQPVQLVAFFPTIAAGCVAYFVSKRATSKRRINAP